MFSPSIKEKSANSQGILINVLGISPASAFNYSFPSIEKGIK